ncbi:hypothetical protein [Microbulbifer sp. GL-2]|uniref:hypothetical protein n=1 Tax=Microbulbifer sp. GL-2 TaxID=2591606 RepID=UPI0011656EB3|nr:hypothetical protein [Microbulbifer sp. GL-2]BBM00470.1 hypothetical protein GL2_05440 [Microbulbifer sp. GL-2]
MSAIVFVHPTAMSKSNIDHLKRRIALIDCGNQKSQRIRLVQPKPTFARPVNTNDWPPFGGDAA